MLQNRAVLVLAASSIPHTFKTRVATSKMNWLRVTCIGTRAPFVVPDIAEHQIEPVFAFACSSACLRTLVSRLDTTRISLAVDLDQNGVFLLAYSYALAEDGRV